MDSSNTSGPSSIGDDTESSASSSAESPDISGAARLAMALSHKQRLALEALLQTGLNVPAAADKAGVNRGTLNRWMLDDANFIAAFNARLLEMIMVDHARMLAIVPKALKAIEDAIDNGDARVAMQFLKCVMQLPQKMLPISASVVADQLKVAERQQEVELATKQVELDRQENATIDAARAVAMAQYQREHEKKPFLQRHEEAQRFYHTCMAEGPITQARMDEIDRRVAAEVKQTMAERKQREAAEAAMKSNAQSDPKSEPKSDPKSASPAAPGQSNPGTVRSDGGVKSSKPSKLDPRVASVAQKVATNLANPGRDAMGK